LPAVEVEVEVEVDVEVLVPQPPAWVEVAVAVAVWAVGALWITTWDCPAPPAWVEGAVWVCSAVCVTVFELTAVEAAVEVFVPALVVDEPRAAGIQIWISVPSTPSLFGSLAGPYEIETPPLVGDACVDVAVESAVCDVGAFWTRTCDWPPVDPPAVCVWPADCVTALVFPASAVACEELVCVTAAVSPGLLFRTTMFTFKGFTCVERASALETCVVGALWTESCVWPVPVPPPTAWFCVPAWVASFVLPEVASATEEFVCVTGPSLPGLSTRTTTLTLVGACWVDVALASLVCFVGALCAADWLWPDEAAPAPDGAVCAWELLWLVALVFPAELFAVFLLLCSAAWPPVLTFAGA
jgi:hypothetical protein